MNKQIVILTVLGLLMLAGCKNNDDDITAKTEISAEIVEETSVSATEEAAKTVTKEADTEEQKAEEPKETEKSADTEEAQEAEAVNAEKSEEVADAEKPHAVAVSFPIFISTNTVTSGSDRIVVATASSYPVETPSS